MRNLLDKLLDVRDEFMDWYEDHKKAFLIGIGSLVFLLIAFFSFNIYATNQKKEEISKAHAAISKQFNDFSAEIKGLYVPERSNFPQEGVTPEVMTALDNKLKEISKNVTKSIDLKSPLSKSAAEDLLKLKNNVKSQIEELQLRIDNKTAIAELFESSPIVGGEVLQNPQVKEGLNVDKIDEVTKKLARPSDDFYSEINNLRNIAWNQLQLLEQINKRLDQLKDSETGAFKKDVLLSDIEQVVPMIAGLSNKNVRNRYYSDLEPYVVKILDVQFSRLIDTSGKVKDKISEGVIKALSLDIASLQNPTYTAKYQVLFNRVASEQQKQEAEKARKERESNGYKSQDRIGQSSDATVTTNVDASYLDNLDKGTLDSSSSSSSNGGNTSNENLSLSQILAKYQGLTWFQDANGDYFYQENGQYVKFDLSKPVGVDNGVNVYYHPVNKVLYTLDANGQAQQYTPRP